MNNTVIAASILLVCACDPPAFEVGVSTASNAIVADPMAAVADTTIYQNSPSHSGGADQSLRVGQGGAMGGNQVYRGLVRFDLEAVGLTGARATRVVVESQIIGISGMAVASDLRLHRVTAKWAEGSSPGGGLGQPCDDANAHGGATWNSVDCIAPWTTPGGDFNEAPSAEISSSLIINDVLRWESEALRDDVNIWLSDPDLNHGWLIRSHQEDVSNTAHRLASRTHSSGGFSLQIEYTGPNGSACTLNEDCTNSHCVSGICCATACDTPVIANCETSNGATCSDGETCQYPDAPDGTACDDNEVCTVDSCEAGVCVRRAIERTCDDGSPCSTDDVCVDGVCTGFINPCAVNLDADVKAQTQCTEIDTENYGCICPNGYESNGSTCVDLDECEASPCDSESACTNRVGSFTCTPLPSGCATTSPLFFLIGRRRRARKQAEAGQTGIPR